MSGEHLQATPQEESISLLLIEIPSDIDKKELPERLDPILKRLAQMDEPLAETYLRGDIKQRFGLVNTEVNAYRKVYQRYRSEHLLSRDSEEDSSPAGQTGYRRSADGLRQLRLQDGYCRYVPLTNFDARIHSEVILDDGLESQRLFEIEAGLNGETHRFLVPAKQFSGMLWVPENLGAEAVVYVGAKDHACAAIQILSERVPKRWVFTHTGWRQVDGHWVYLHALVVRLVRLVRILR